MLGDQDMLFEQATREAVRFKSSTGNISTEDAWNLPLTHERKDSLDSISKLLLKEKKDNEEESLVKETSATSKLLDLKLKILKHIIAVKQQEAKAAELAAAEKVYEQKVLRALEEKKDDALKGKTVEELEEIAVEIRRKKEAS